MQHKGEIDLVTEVDRACEAAILEILRARFPEHDIVTEETHLERTGSRYVWFVDPLDGTTNFAHGYPVLLLLGGAGRGRRGRGGRRLRPLQGGALHGRARRGVRT